MDCNDRIGMWQKDHTAQSPSACQVLPEWARHLVVCRTRQAQHKTRRASHRPSACGSSHPTLTIQCTSRSSDRKTAIRKSRANGLRCPAIMSRKDACRAANGGLSILSRSDQVCSAQPTLVSHASRHGSTTSHPARRLSSTSAITRHARERHPCKKRPIACSACMALFVNSANQHGKPDLIASKNVEQMVGVHQLLRYHTRMN